MPREGSRSWSIKDNCNSYECEVGIEFNSETLLHLTRWKLKRPTASHKLCATLPASININYHLSSTCTIVFVLLRHIRIEIINGSHTMLLVSTWVGKILVNFTPCCHLV